MLKEVKPEEINLNPFKSIGSEWMLIAAADKNGESNAMTASWGGMGVMWGKNAAFIVVRPNRYTKEFIDDSEEFSLSFFGGEYKKELGYMGSVSGRTEEKMIKCGLKTQIKDGVPYFTDACAVLICSVMSAQKIDPRCFMSPDIEKWYPEKDYHTLYIAEIKSALIKE